MNKRKETTATRFAVETEIGVAFVIQTGRNESRVILNSPSTKCQIHWITPRSFASTFLLSLLFRRAQESKFFLSIWIKLPRLEKLNVSISGKWYQMESWRTFRREFASNVALSLSLSLSLCGLVVIRDEISGETLFRKIRACRSPFDEIPGNWNETSVACIAARSARRCRNLNICHACYVLAESFL